MESNPRFSHYLKYMDDWDKKLEKGTHEPRDLNIKLIYCFYTKENNIAQKLRYAYNQCEIYLKRLNLY